MTVSNILLIDDLRSFKDDRTATVLRTSKNALKFLQTHPNIVWDEIWLDHDLGLASDAMVPDTIMSVVDYFCEKAFNNDPVKVNIINIHTSNPVGRKQIALSLQRFGYQTRAMQAETFFKV